MAWIVLVVAGLFETVWAVGLKYTDGFTRLWPSLGVVVALAISMVLLAWSAKQLPIGTAYAVWVGIGAFGVALYGMLVLGEPATWPRIAFLVLLLGSIAGLKLTAQGG